MEVKKGDTVKLKNGETGKVHSVMPNGITVDLPHKSGTKYVQHGKYEIIKESLNKLEQKLRSYIRTEIQTIIAKGVVLQFQNDKKKYIKFLTKKWMSTKRGGYPGFIKDSEAIFKKLKGKYPVDDSDDGKAIERGLGQFERWYLNYSGPF